MPSLLRPGMMFLLAAAAAACSGGDDDDGESYNCEAEDRDEDFVAGMEKTDGETTFKLVSSAPAPPTRGDNVWILEIRTANAPYEGAVEVTPFMPDHRHGTSIVTVVTPVAGTPGQYDAMPVNLFMPGLWEITVETQPTPTTGDSVVFRFCVSG